MYLFKWVINFGEDMKEFEDECSKKLTKLDKIMMKKIGLELNKHDNAILVLSTPKKCGMSYYSLKMCELMGVDWKSLYYPRNTNSKVVSKGENE